MDAEGILESTEEAYGIANLKASDVYGLRVSAEICGREATQERGGRDEFGRLSSF